MTFDVARWLESIGLVQCEELFREPGFADLMVFALTSS